MANSASSISAGELMTDRMGNENGFDESSLAEEQRRENLEISNDYLFGRVMQDKELCLELIRLILPKTEIDDISMPESQKAIRPDMDARGVRFDIYVRGTDGTAFDIEMEMRFSRYLPKRARYYGAMIDMNLLDKGISYKALKLRVIIFICPFDLFGRGLHRYTFKSLCAEDSSIVSDDGTMTVFLNAEGVQNDVSPGLKAFLDLVAGRSSEDGYVRRVEAAVEKAKMKRSSHSNALRRHRSVPSGRDRPDRKRPHPAFHKSHESPTEYSFLPRTESGNTWGERLKICP